MFFIKMSSLIVEEGGTHDGRTTSGFVSFVVILSSDLSRYFKFPWIALICVRYSDITKRKKAVDAIRQCKYN